MQYGKKIFSLAAAALLMASPLAAKAQQPAPPAGQQVVALATERPLAELLPDKLAGFRASGDVKRYTADGLAELVADEARVYQEYRVVRAASRQYGAARVDLFETESPLAAFGLLTYASGSGGGKAREVGSGGALAGGALLFWKDNYFVRVTNADAQLARAVAGAIIPKDPAARPRLLDDLPRQAVIAGSHRYFLGPESLNAYVERGREMFGFAGDAEAVMAEYAQNSAAAPPPPAPKDSSNTTGSNKPAVSGSLNPHGLAAQGPPLKIVIIEYKTPQFAYDAMARATDYVSSLGEADRGRVIIKREGNYIVEAVNFQDRAAAQALVDAVKYPYGVKWINDPRRPPRDPFRMQKAAQMLVSTFGLLGLLLLTVFVGGAIFGTTIFLKRRKQQQEVFSDAGGMLRLELDPFERSLLGLPPKRD
jgi:hypothetical protein